MPLERILARSDLEPGHCREVQIRDRTLVVVQENGEVFALDGICTHAGGPMSMGWVEDGRISCPLHGAEFDIRTGKRVSQLARADLTSYPVKIEGEDVFVEIPD